MTEVTITPEVVSEMLLGLIVGGAIGTAFVYAVMGAVTLIGRWVR